MKTVLIANGDLAEGQKLVEIVSQEFDAALITAPSEQPQDTKDYHLVLIDSNFTESFGMEFLVDILKKSYFPVLMITPLDNPKCAADALKLGAFNYIIKTGQYYDFVNILIKDAIHKFEQYEEMKQTIIDLKKKVNELEQQVASGSRSGEISNTKKHTEEIAPQNRESAQSKPRRNAFDDVVARLRKGDINLPSPPLIQIQFNEMLKNKKGLHEIANLLKQDIAISSQLIRVSNSAYYQGMVQNITLEQALTRLGLNTIKQYVEIICNRSLYAAKKKKNMQWMEKLWKHSLGSALAAQFACEAIQQKQADEIFTMALIHDIGELILLQIMGELDIDICDETMNEEDRTELSSALMLNHGTFGAMLLKKWGFSELYQQIALYHSNPERADPISRELLIVSFADLVAKTIGYATQDKPLVEIEEAFSTNLLKLDSEKITIVKEKVKEHMNNLQSIF
jgi:HD-like signal output (HDOD) protein/response regulator of citrate/malate metabolism